MKTKLFSIFAASAMMLAASCSSTDVEKSLLPDEPVNGECVTVNVAVPAGDMPMSRAVPEGWELRYVLWLIPVDEEGNPVVDNNGLLEGAQFTSAPCASGNSIKFTGVAPGKYAICAFCCYFKEGVETLESQVPYGLFSERSIEYVSMGQIKDSENSDDNVINFYNELYDCWKAKSDFEKTETNCSLSIVLKRAVSVVTFKNTTDFTNENLESLEFGCFNFNLGINLWSDEANTLVHGNFGWKITDWSKAESNKDLVRIYLPKQSGTCRFVFTPTAKPDMDDPDFDYFKVATVNLAFDKANVIYNVFGKFLVDCGTKVTVDVSTDNNWVSGSSSTILSDSQIEYSNPQLGN